MGRIIFDQSVHVKGLNRTLISVSEKCDKGNIVLSAKDESSKFNITKCSVNKEDIEGKAYIETRKSV